MKIDALCGENEKRFSMLITAICADYQRRKEAIEQGLVGKRVRMEYSYINARVFEGAGEICGGALAEAFIADIGDRNGYCKSNIVCFSENTYKQYKRMIKLNIARKLKLLD